MLVCDPDKPIQEFRIADLPPCSLKPSESQQTCFAEVFNIDQHAMVLPAISCKRLTTTHTATNYFYGAKESHSVSVTIPPPSVADCHSWNSTLYVNNLGKHETISTNEFVTKNEPQPKFVWPRTTTTTVDNAVLTRVDLLYNPVTQKIASAFAPLQNCHVKDGSCTFIDRVIVWVNPKSFLCPRLRFVCKETLKIHLDSNSQPFPLQLLRSGFSFHSWSDCPAEYKTCVDSRLICTSTPVTLKVHGCCWTTLTTKVNYVSDLYPLNRTLLAPVTGLFNDVLDRSLSAIKDTDAQVNCLACRLESYLLQILRVVAEPYPSEVLQPLLASPTATTFQHGILTQFACKESTATLLRSLQYGSKFGLRPLFAYQDQTSGRVLVQLYSGNVIFLGLPSLEEYQMHRVQRFNIQCRIYTYVNYTLQFSSEPMRQLSM